MHHTTTRNRFFSVNNRLGVHSVIKHLATLNRATELEPVKPGSWGCNSVVLLSTHEAEFHTQ